MEITWTICKTKQKNNSGKLYYSRKEEAFIMEEETLSDFSFMVGKQYVSLDASIESSSIVGVSGFCSPDHWLYQAFDTPTCEEGLLSFSSDEPLLSGTGCQLKSSWETFFNPNTKWFKLSDTLSHTQTEWIGFQNDCIAEIKKGALVGLYLKPIMIK